MRRYLVVDDNAAFADNLAEILEDTGSAVDLACHGTHALQQVSVHCYDALITDMQMPGMGGAELICRARHLDPGVPAIVVTAFTSDGDLNVARYQGLVGVLPKPVPIARLLALASAARRNGLVVMVEDDRALADSLTEALATSGFSTVTVGSVDETQQLADVAPFVGLVDLRVHGGQDGIAMTRLRERFQGLPVVGIAAQVDATWPLPAEIIFRKPVDVETLLDCVARLYEHSTVAATT